MTEQGPSRHNRQPWVGNTEADGADGVDDKERGPDDKKRGADDRECGRGRKRTRADDWERGREQRGIEGRQQRTWGLTTRNAWVDAGERAADDRKRRRMTGNASGRWRTRADDKELGRTTGKVGQTIGNESG